MLIGYARVSTEDQKLRLQHDALTDGGCEKLFREKLSGTSTTLPAREKLLAFARKGDVVVVWKLDRLGRSLRDLIGVVNSLQDRGVGLRSLQVSCFCKRRRRLSSRASINSWASAADGGGVGLAGVRVPDVGGEELEDALGGGRVGGEEGGELDPAARESFRRGG